MSKDRRRNDRRAGMVYVEIVETGTHKKLDIKEVEILELRRKLILARRMLREKITEKQLDQVLLETDPVFKGI